MQGTWVWFLVQEIPQAWHYNYWVHVPQVLKPVSFRLQEPQLLSPIAATTEAHVPRVCAPQQEKALQWEVQVPQERVAPACCN